MDEHENASAPETVRLRHPHTGDVQEVEAMPEKMTPWMCRGYVQFQPAPAIPAQGEE
jgi:hypothetical protein